MKLALSDMPAWVINLDRSRDRWIRFCRAFGETIPEMNFEQVSGVDGREFLQATRRSGLLGKIGKALRIRGFADPSKTDPAGKASQPWRREVLAKLRAEGFVGQRHLLDPVRTALCMSHQRALRNFLDRAAEGGKNPSDTWGIVFEDDARPGEALAACRESRIEIDVPSDSEVLFLHDRTWKRGASVRDPAPSCVKWRMVRGGIGLEAYAVNVPGARKILDAFRPVIVECDIQLMTFMEGYADLERQRELRRKLADEGMEKFPAIRAYAPVAPFFQTDHWQASVKFDTIAEGR